jgi:integrase
VARRRFQRGQLFKSGRRRKVWVGRWREDVLLENGTIGQVRRWQVLGTVADLPTRREAQTLLDARVRTINAGASRPEALINFGTFEGKFQLPKTLKATRTIPLGRHAVAALKAHRERANRTAPDDLVFGNRGGKPLRESQLLRNVLQPAGERAGVGRVKWHPFRHIHSSLLNDLKVPVKIAQEQLGHASVSTTLSIYTHVIDASHRKAVEALEERLFGGNGLFWTELAGNRGSGLSRKWHFSLGL